jgi:hypothetical protein
MKVPEDSSSGFPSSAEIKVDPTHLDKFAGSVDHEVESNFKPHTDQLFTAYSYGAVFGTGIPSTNVQMARRKHTDSLNAASEAMTNYIEASKILVAAMRTIAQRYSTADAMSGLRSDEVAAILGKAKDDADAARRAADEAARRQEAEFRRTHHGQAMI